MILCEAAIRAENHGVMKVWWPGVAIAVAAGGLGVIGTATGEGPRLALASAGCGGVIAALAAVTFALRGRSKQTLPDAGLVRAVHAWDSGDLGALQAWVADLVGSDAASHAARTASLCQHMADQLAVRPDEVDALLLSALAHVAPAAFESGDGSCPRFSAEAFDHAVRALEKAGHSESATIIRQVGERWDGLGSPIGLVGEAASLRGRVLATACAFDLASARGLQAGLDAVRQGSGSAFDPVVAAELLYLFREPWQMRQAA